MTSRHFVTATLALLTCSFTCLAVALAAQNPPATPPQTNQICTARAPVLCVESVITRDFEGVVRLDKPPTDEERRRGWPTPGEKKSLGENIRLHVVNLSEWMKVDAPNSSTPNSPWTLTLFLNERPLKGLHPISVDPELGYLIFSLERTADNESTWGELMDRRKNWEWGKEKENAKEWGRVARRLRASVGTEGGVAVESYASFEMVFLPVSWLFFILAATVLSFALLVILGRKSALLRSSAHGPFSLSRTQMALWSWLTLNAYLYLTALNHDPAVTIPVSVLGLLGISATTYLAAAMVDRSSPGGPEETSRGFFRDIAGGANVSLHRLQMIGWTLVLAIAFIAQVLNRLSIPDFNPTLLGLMGLSAGTYVGFKFPENQAAKPGDSAKTVAASAGE